MEEGNKIGRPESGFKFSKEERLRHRSLVEKLFRKGKSFYEFPLRVTWLKLTPEELAENFCDHTPEGIDGLQVMITVPKRKRKRAVDRVLLRRRIREAYRLNRLPLKSAALSNPKLATFSLSFVYIHDENLPFDFIQQKMKKALGRLEAEASR